MNKFNTQTDIRYLRGYIKKIIIANQIRFIIRI
jgi:hypothetical protein